jgi:hypothetical protein
MASPLEFRRVRIQDIVVILFPYVIDCEGIQCELVAGAFFFFFLASFRCDSQRVDCDVSPWSQWDSLRIDFSAWQHECTMTHEHCKDLEGRKLMEIRYIGSRNRSLRGSLLCL